MHDDLPPISFRALMARINWLFKLRSNAYKQGRTRLRTVDGMCCLGVATDIACEAGMVKGEWMNLAPPETPQWRFLMPDGTHVVTVAPPPVIELYELDGDLGMIRTGYLDEHDLPMDMALSDLNDGHGPYRTGSDERGNFTFAQIADIIEYFMVRPYIVGNDVTTEEEA